MQHSNAFLISKMFQLVTKARHSGMDAGIQSQGCEAMSGTAPCNAAGNSKLPSMALDTGIHAAMTVLAEVPC